MLETREMMVTRGGQVAKPMGKYTRQ